MTRAKSITRDDAKIRSIYNEIDDCISKGRGLQAKGLLTQYAAAIDEFNKVDFNELSEAQKKRYYALETLVASFDVGEASRRAEKAAEVESEAEETRIAVEQQKLEAARKSMEDARRNDEAADAARLREEEAVRRLGKLKALHIKLQTAGELYRQGSGEAVKLDRILNEATDICAEDVPTPEIEECYQRLNETYRTARVLSPPSSVGGDGSSDEEDDRHSLPEDNSVPVNTTQPPTQIVMNSPVDIATFPPLPADPLEFGDWAKRISARITLSGATDKQALLALSDMRVVPSHSLRTMVEQCETPDQALHKMEERLLPATVVGELIGQRWRNAERPKDDTLDEFIRSMRSDIKRLNDTHVQHVFSPYNLVKAAIMRLPNSVASPCLVELKRNQSQLDVVIDRIEQMMMEQAELRKCQKEAGLVNQAKDPKKNTKQKATVNNVTASDGGEQSKAADGNKKKEYPCMLEECNLTHSNPVSCKKVMSLGVEARRKLVKEQYRCFRCCRKNHKAGECRSNIVCNVGDCKRHHHPALHLDRPASETAAVNVAADEE